MLNFVGKVKNILHEYQNNKRIQLEQLAELEWAHIYRDTIRGKKWLEDLGISPGRWAGNYSFFYVLTRILLDFKPKKIIEFGLGESSKLISTFLENDLRDSTHLIIEQSNEWSDMFKSRFTLSTHSRILNLPMIVNDVHEVQVNRYEGIENKVNESFDLYVIDGPLGSEHFSRYDICILVEKLNQNDEFIILLDDYDRQGEKDTANDLIDILNKNGITFYTAVYSGNKSQILFVTEKYKYVRSL